MASADEILAIITTAIYVLFLGQFGIRFARTRWWIYGAFSFFSCIRITGYSIRAYLESNSIKVGSSRWTSLFLGDTILLSIGVIFILVVLAGFYQSLIPKLRYHYGNQGKGIFEIWMVERTRLFLMPIIILVLVGVGISTPDNSPSHINAGLILRKISILALLAISLLFLHAAWDYGRRYKNHAFPFKLCMLVSALFSASLIYKIIATFVLSIAPVVWAIYVFGPLLEILAILVLCIDLQTPFMGRKEDEIVIEKDSEQSSQESTEESVDKSDTHQLSSL
ncbi:hypothetical protein BGZ99_008076 [Dissophora globulifera]|uniref:Uncharacterized protein n=1 Tax=Dissophora globulifera TaxID=979702 RepID=A0A9P6R7V9_9FUNG|nr:hypothetical protein BGZ99_008076 [Dissophora globulifera]